MTTANPRPTPPLFLGIDTGGTFTDAVLWSEDGGLAAKAKALTTRHDLAIGIAGAVEAVLARAACAVGDIKLVSMSTTLATNALVEGQGERSALVMIGFDPADLARDGLQTALGSDPVIFCPGGHDVFGQPAPLVLDALDARLDELAVSVSGFAVCGHFAVRNPAHEIAVRDHIKARTGLPVTCSHELSSKLGGPKRALTTLFNARLISLIDRLVTATERFLAQRGIIAPLMVVRGDGALVSAHFALARPIETILSGPAASLVGARHLTGLDRAIVADIGGTTTDVAVLEAGRPRLDPEGASIGGFRTMVEAVAVRTFGLGGDSQVWLEHSGLVPKLGLGPRRVVPLALAAAMHGDAILKPLQRQLGAGTPNRLDGCFAIRTGVPDRLAAGLTASEAALFARVTDQPLPLDGLLTSAAHMSRLDRLVARGLVHLIGLTPTNAAHILGLQSTWDSTASGLGATLMARQRDGRGLPIAASGIDLAGTVLAMLKRRSAEAILETAFAEDGLDGAAMVAQDLIQRALDGRQGIARVRVGLDRPVIGLGASAALHYAGLEPLVGNACVLPADADVANALGAVVGQVRIAAEALVSLAPDGAFRASCGDWRQDCSSEAEAIGLAEARAREAALSLARAAGSDAAELTVTQDVRAVVVDGLRCFLEAHVIAVAAGRPRIAS